jgi:hypothetical protein
MASPTDEEMIRVLQRAAHRLRLGRPKSFTKDALSQEMMTSPILAIALREEIDEYKTGEDDYEIAQHIDDLDANTKSLLIDASLSIYTFD